MRQALSKGMLSAAAATSILSLSGTSAFAADASAQALDSPGLLSGNSVQAPLEVPVNLCGNTVDAVALANPASGNDCSSSSKPAPAAHGDSGYGDSGYGQADNGYAGHDDTEITPATPHGPGDDTGYADSGGSSADAQTAQSPGLLSGNNVQAPVEAPVEVCGDSVGGVAVASGAYGNTCEEAPPQETPPAQPPGVDVP
ncbi:chaplin, partial [Streptomyces silaceus]